MSNETYVSYPGGLGNGGIHKLRRQARGRGVSQMPMLLHKYISNVVIFLPHNLPPKKGNVVEYMALWVNMELWLPLINLIMLLWENCPGSNPAWFTIKPFKFNGSPMIQPYKNWIYLTPKQFEPRFLPLSWTLIGH